MAEIKNDTPVVVPEKKVNENLDLAKKGAIVGAASAAGGLVIIGAAYMLEKAYNTGKEIVGKLIVAGKEKRAAKKAAKAEKKSSKEDKGGEA